MKKIRTVLVDDHEIFRSGLRLLLSRIDTIEVIGEASNGNEFLDFLINETPDLAFVDISMPVLDGIDATKKALEICPDLKIIALTSFSDPEYFDNMLCAGAEGYMLKNSSLEEFKKAVKRVTAGDNYYSQDLLMSITKNLIVEKTQRSKQAFLPDLSKREKEVLELICKGYSNQNIGEKLFISDRTVERHKTNLYEKTGTQNSVNLVIYAFKNKLVGF
ncbi:MAG: response regulator transcription factor [Bacteroidales bacterium]|nr:response regulator transcription factor [Bacteroidales bacterium]